jgi:ActR/RegA family two-component response regulator
MSFNALLVSGDTSSLGVLCAALEELKIEQETCRSVPDALELLAVEPYSALLVDFDLPGAAHVVRMARMAPPQRRPVVFALLSLHADVVDTFQCGANFVLNKPADVHQIFRSLRAGRAFMRRDRRRAARHKTEALVYLRFGDLCPMPAIVLDLNERGLAIQAAEPLPPSRIPLRFILPGTEFLIEGRGDVIWADDGGRAGILFTEMPASSKRQLKQWVAKRDRRKPVNFSAARTSKSRPQSARLS